MVRSTQVAHGGGGGIHTYIIPELVDFFTHTLEEEDGFKLLPDYRKKVTRLITDMIDKKS